MRASAYVIAFAGLVLGQSMVAAEPAVTIYNQDFAVVRETIPLDLKQGTNDVSFAGVTAHLEPDSVMLRDPSGKRALQILEQNYRADPVSQGLLLSLFEGKTINFRVHTADTVEIVPGKIVRSGYVAHSGGLRRYGQQYYQQQMAMAYPQGGGNEPIIEVNGELRFNLPGEPLFPSLGDDTILKPMLQWIINTNEPGPLDAELGYVTGGMSWEASYNLVGADKTDVVDLVGWVTMDNQSGKTFENARVKLMAGDVSKIKEDVPMMAYAAGRAMSEMDAMAPTVSEKAFDEYHLYTIARPTTIRDRETKQIEFVRAMGIKADRFYVYDGLKLDPNQYRGYSTDQVMQQREYGTQSQTHVWAMREIKNTKENGLGIPIPAGRTRFYQRDDDNQLEFIGENTVQHTPKDETLRIYTGDAFDLVGERIATDFKCQYDEHWADETFEIKLRNHKEVPVEIRVIEHLYRGVNWTIKNESDTYKKMDRQMIEFRVQVPPDQEKVISYLVHYTW